MKLKTRFTFLYQAHDGSIMRPESFLNINKGRTLSGSQLRALGITKIKCPQASRSCKPDGWPKGNPKWNKQQAIQETVPYNDIEEATSDDK